MTSRLTRIALVRGPAVTVHAEGAGATERAGARRQPRGRKPVGFEVDDRLASREKLEIRPLKSKPR